MLFFAFRCRAVPASDEKNHDWQHFANLMMTAVATLFLRMSKLIVSQTSKICTDVQVLYILKYLHLRSLWYYFSFTCFLTLGFSLWKAHLSSQFGKSFGLEALELAKEAERKDIELWAITQRIQSAKLRRWEGEDVGKFLCKMQSD